MPATIVDKQTSELRFGDVVALGRAVTQTPDGPRYSRYALARPPSLRSGRWLTVASFTGMPNSGYVRVLFAEGGSAITPVANTAWYVRTTTDSPSDETESR